MAAVRINHSQRSFWHPFPQKPITSKPHLSETVQSLREWYTGWEAIQRVGSLVQSTLLSEIVPACHQLDRLAKRQRGHAKHSCQLPLWSCQASPSSSSLHLTALWGPSLRKSPASSLPSITAIAYSFQRWPDRVRPQRWRSYLRYP